NSSIVTDSEVELLYQEFSQVADEQGLMHRDQFKMIVGNFVVASSATELFLERLFHAFDTDHDDAVNFREYIHGLSIFAKGAPEEKLRLSFDLYDVDQTGSVSRDTMAKILAELYVPFCSPDQSAQIQGVVDRIFSDLDVDNDGKLTFSEFHLAALKEPVFDLLSQFLAPP
ncbi:MAG: hypothetical protein DHS80DRAFT_4303, partial [Piptocephalis tieghemiana]